MDRYDEEAEERAAAVAEVAARLRSRGIALTGAEDPGDLADLLSAVERFEAAVEAHRGDLMVDDLKSSRPDDRHFVVPRRAHGEGARTYIVRLHEATAQLRPPPPAAAPATRAGRGRADLYRPHRGGDDAAAPPSAAARLSSEHERPIPRAIAVRRRRLVAAAAHGRRRVLR